MGNGLSQKEIKQFTMTKIETRLIALAKMRPDCIWDGD